MSQTSSKPIHGPVLVTGANGQLGTELMLLLGGQSVGLTQDDVDLTDFDGLRRAVRHQRPAWLINCAAYTAVDQAEEEPQLCHKVNAEAVGVLAEVCNEIGARLVQISTDYVFCQSAPERIPRGEEDAVDPRGVYAQSKYQGEQAAAQAAEHLVVRTCGLYAGGPTQRNFVETMLRLAVQRDELSVVDDQTCTPSSAKHVAQGIVELMRHDQRGLFHVVNQGETTWYGFAQKIFELSTLPVKVVPITSAQFAAKSPRPAYSVLSTARYESVGCRPLATWDEALAEYLRERKAELAAEG